MSVTAAKGFTASAVACGIKGPDSLDLALVVAAPGSIGTGVFTVNQAAAAPVLTSRRHLAAGPSTRAVVVNSGCANAATGVEGDAAAQAVAEAVAVAIGCDPEEVLVASTGPIGPRLPVMAVTTGIAAAVTRLTTGKIADGSAATAILTTDTVPKLATRHAGDVTVGGMAKGAGMVRPDMATMLAVLTTDAVAAPTDLEAALCTAVDESFHALNIDGCASTNDSAFLVASGASGISLDAGTLGRLVTDTCRDLAAQLAADAEGASRVVTLEVRGAVDAATARQMGRAVADSALVRASFFGGDPNWGRIVSALGTTAIPFEPGAMAVAYDGVPVASGGVAVEYDEAKLIDRLADGNFTVTLTVGDGEGAAQVLTTDLTPQYVVFNGERS